VTRGARTAITAAVVALALTVMGAGFPTKQVPPEKFAGGVCTVMNDFQGTALGSDVVSMTMSTMAGKGPSLRAIRRMSVRYYAEVAEASQDAARKVATLGDPEMPRGHEIARGMVRLFGRLHAATVRVHRDAKDISNRSELEAVGKDFTRAFDRFTAGSAKLRRLDPADRLEQAADASTACDAKPLKPSR
jgi:hypothetical protein